MTTFRLTTKAACRVAQIDRQRLNELISSGDYSVAPETVPGRSRLFDEIDLIALFIFARLFERDWRPLRAGLLASNIITQLRKDSAAGEVTVFSPIASSLTRAIEKPQEVAGAHNGGMAVLYTQTFNIETVRDLVRAGIEEERAVIGEDE